MLIGLFFDAAIIGIIIAVMQSDSFPGWPQTVGIVLSIGVTATVVGHFLPDSLWFLATAAGALVGIFVISHLCYMTLQRSAQAAGIYFLVRIVMGFGVAMLMAS